MSNMKPIETLKPVQVSLTDMHLLEKFGPLSHIDGKNAVFLELGKTNDPTVQKTEGYKPYDYASYEKPLSLVEKHVKWLRKGGNGFVKTAKIMLVVLEVILLFASVIGIPLLRKGINTATELNKVDHYMAGVKNKRKPEIEEPIAIKSETRTFNHACEFVIHDDVIWHRPRTGDHREWTPIYFDAYHPSVKPRKISCDGANLLVLDNEGYVHYKKVLKEFRAEDVQKKAKKHLENPENYGEKHLVFDKSHLNNWKKKWFSVPVLHHLVNLFTGKRLRLPPDARAFAISHRGSYNNYTEDAVGQKHHVQEGVTTLYQLNADGRTIRKYDPWAPKWTVAEIYMPETAHSIYEANNMSCSSSTIMAIGYDKDNKGHKSLKIITRLADIDTEGANPVLKYSFEKDPKNKKVRVLPIEYEWKEHPLPEGAKVTEQITILQTGEGNNARELRVVGELNGHRGYFYKKVTDDTWEFKPQEGIEVSRFLEREKQDEPKELKNRVEDLTVKICGKNGDTIDDAELRNFGKRSTVSKVDFVYKDKKYSFALYRRMTFWNFINIKKYRYDLIIPEKDRHDEAIKELFGNRVSYQVKVNRRKKGVQIVPKKGKFTIAQ